MDNLVKQAKEARINNTAKNSKKKVVNNEPPKQGVKASPPEAPKTPGKKSFPTRMRDQINSCKKPESKKIINALEDYNKKQSVPQYNKKLSKDRLNYNHRPNGNNYSKIPSSYYTDEYATKPAAKTHNKVNMSRALVKDSMKKGKATLLRMKSPPQTISSKLDKTTNGKFSRHGTRHTKKVTQSPQMGGGTKPPSRRMGASHYRVAMESGNYNKGHIRNGGMTMGGMAMGGTAESPEKNYEVQQIPLKVFDMHGHTRHPIKADEMQGSTIYKRDMEYSLPMGGSIRRTASKQRRSKDRVH